MLEEVTPLINAEFYLIRALCRSRFQRDNDDVTLVGLNHWDFVVFEIFKMKNRLRKEAVLSSKPIISFLP